MVSLQSNGSVESAEDVTACSPTKETGTTGNRNKCLAHHKNDSGSYDTAPNGLLASSSGSEAITNGRGVGCGRDGEPRSVDPVLTLASVLQEVVGDPPHGRQGWDPWVCDVCNSVMSHWVCLLV